MANLDMYVEVVLCDGLYSTGTYNLIMHICGLLDRC